MLRIFGLDRSSIDPDRSKPILVPIRIDMRNCGFSPSLVDCETRARLVRLRSFPRERDGLVEEFRLSVELGKADEFMFSVAWSICGVEAGTLPLEVSAGGATDGV